VRQPAFAQSTGATQVQVLLSNAGCVPSTSQIAAGPVTFSIRNVLASTITARFHDLDAALAPYSTGNGQWQPYDRLGASDIRALSDAVNNLAHPLSLVAAQVVVASGGSFATPTAP
jgi:hypothetical protein